MRLRRWMLRLLGCRCEASSPHFYIKDGMYRLKALDDPAFRRSAIDALRAEIRRGGRLPATLAEVGR